MALNRNTTGTRYRKPGDITSEMGQPDTYQTQQSCGRINHKEKRLVPSYKELLLGYCDFYQIVADQ